MASLANNVKDMTGEDRSFENLLAQVNDLQNPREPSHSGGGGDGGDMHERVAKLESSMEHVQRDVSGLRTDMRDVRDRLKSLEVKVDHLPSKGFIVTTLIAGLALIAALLGFTDQIQAFFGNGPPSSVPK